jgi:colicin import membrane protein
MLSIKIDLGEGKMTKPTRTPTRPKRSKAEIEQEFSEIQEEVAVARETGAPKSRDLLKLHEAGVVQAVEGMSVEGVVQEISALGLDISKALSGISDMLVQEVNRLASVRDAVALERNELERLHKIDVAATALDQLVQDYTREKERLELEMAAQRKAWADESQRSERERKEQEENLKKQRQREMEEYEYKKALERKKAQDKYEEERQLQEKQNREKQEALEKSWQEREATVHNREEELARLRQESAEFAARLQKEAEQAAAQATRVTEAKFEQHVLLLKKEAETEKRVAELQVKALEETAARQLTQIATLQKQLDEAKQQVQDIAVKAIEGASGARALSHINQIAMEQAKHRTTE